MHCKYNFGTFDTAHYTDKRDAQLILENKILIHFIILVLESLKSGHISGMPRLESATIKEFHFIPHFKMLRENRNEKRQFIDWRHLQY